MKEIKIRDKTFVQYITFEEIEFEIKRVSKAIYEEYKNETPVFVGVLSGVLMFMSDFLKHYPGDCEISFLKISSYQGIHSTGEIKTEMHIPMDLTNRHVVILEDIVDTGRTLVEIHKTLNNLPIKSLKVVTLLFKPDAYKQNLDVDLAALSIPDKFVVGYGLDYDGLGRNLPDIYQIKT